MDMSPEDFEIIFNMTEDVHRRVDDLEDKVMAMQIMFNILVTGLQDHDIDLVEMIIRGLARTSADCKVDHKGLLSPQIDDILLFFEAAFADRLKTEKRNRRAAQSLSLSDFLKSR